MGLEYRRFRELLRHGECDTVEFKLECGACRGSKAENAELVKDIVALANNGYVASYLIVGVSDNRRGFKSVANDNLTDDAVQRLCRDNIHPAPKVRLTRETWRRAAVPAQRGKTFVVVQVGPQPRQCFRIARDLTDSAGKLCHRKNEVWLRRGATSDLATPEETARLLGGKPAMAAVTSEGNVDYTRLPRANVRAAVEKDLGELVKAAGGSMFGADHAAAGWPEPPAENPGALGVPMILPINGSYLAMRALVLPGPTRKGSIGFYTKCLLSVQDGLILVFVGSVSELATDGVDQALREPWGWLSVVGEGFIETRRPPEGMALALITFDRPHAERFCLALSRVDCSDKLRRAWTGMLDSLRNDRTMKVILRRTRSQLRATLREWPSDDLHYTEVSRYLAFLQTLSRRRKPRK